MEPRFITIAGTHGTKDEWWKPDSMFVQTIERIGFVYVDKADPFSWSTTLDGIIGSNASWEAAGRALRWYITSKCGDCPITIISHSHGAQVVAYACQQGLKVDRLITCAAPVRKDMEKVWKAARFNIRLWYHLHSKTDKWAILGALMDGRVGISTRMPFADKNVAVQLRHSQFVDPAQWERNAWLNFLKS